MGDMKVSSYKRDRSWGLGNTSTWSDCDGVKYSYAGEVVDPVLGIVKGRVSRWRDGGLSYSAECGFHGMLIDAREDRDGTLSHRSLSRWLWKHGIPALRAAAIGGVL